MEDGDARVCSFCGKPQEQVRTLMAGPGVSMCDECITFGTEFLADGAEEPGSELGEPVTCSFCGTTTSTGDVVASPGGACSCRACVERGRKMIDQELAEPPGGP